MNDGSIWWRRILVMKRWPFISTASLSCKQRPGLLFATQHEVSIGSRETSPSSGYNLPFKGVIDDVRIYDYALSASQVAQLYNGAGPMTPIFHRQVEGASLRVGDSWTFFAIADGIDPLRFQWQKNGVNIPGATTTILALSDLRVKDGGIYNLLVTDRDGAIASSMSTVEVRPFFWQTWWFWSIVSFCVLICLAGMVRFVERRKAPDRS